MKKIILPLLVWFTVISFASEPVKLRISGVVSDSLSGEPLDHYPVHIDIDTATGGFTFHREIFTHPDGIYTDSILLNPEHIPSGIMRVTVQDCLGHPHFADFHFGPGSLVFSKDFLICKDPPPPPCESWFTFMPDWLTIHFEGHIQANSPASYSWEFGDGKTGEGKHADHHYDLPGEYTVKLTTIRQGPDHCTWISSKKVHVGDSSDIHQVYGQVFEGKIPVEHGIAMIFGMDTSGSHPPYFSTSFLNNNGIYSFPYVPEGDFVIYAVPFDSLGEYLPTYYGDVLHWQSAPLVHLGDPQNPYDIHLVHTRGIPPGAGGIQGQVTTARLRFSSLDQITMLLTDDKGEPLGFRRVDAAGDFSFGDIAYGGYFLQPELPGYPGEQVGVTLLAAEPVATVHMTLTDEGILGIERTVSLDKFSLFPNPVKDLMNISLSSKSTLKGTMEILTITGQSVVSVPVTLATGDNRITADTRLLKPGFYLLRITASDGSEVVGKFVR